jgi:hypothetical protein
MMMKVTVICTLCGGKGTIGEERLSRVQSRVLRAVRTAKEGLTVHELSDKVYGDKDGPLSAGERMKKAIRSLNSHLAKAKVVADRPGPGARYRLVAMEGARHADRADHRADHRRQSRRSPHGEPAAREAK